MRSALLPVPKFLYSIDLRGIRGQPTVRGIGTEHSSDHRAPPPRRATEPRGRDSHWRCLRGVYGCRTRHTVGRDRWTLDPLLRRTYGAGGSPGTPAQLPGVGGNVSGVSALSVA